MDSVVKSVPLLLAHVMLEWKDGRSEPVPLLIFDDHVRVHGD
jgi:hypothetical protein